MSYIMDLHTQVTRFGDVQVMLHRNKYDWNVITHIHVENK